MLLVLSEWCNCTLDNDHTYHAALAETGNVRSSDSAFRTNQKPVNQCAHVRVAQALAVDSMCVVLEVTPVKNVIIIVVSKHSYATTRCGSCNVTCTDARGVCSNPSKHAVFV